MSIDAMADKRIDLNRRIEKTHAFAQVCLSHWLKHSAAWLSGPWGAISQ